MSNRRRVVVTGFGLVTAIGSDEKTVWDNLLAGRTGVRKVQCHDVTANHVHNGAEVDFAAIEAGLPPGMRKADRCLKFAFEAARQALAGAGRLVWPPQGTQEIGSIWRQAVATNPNLIAAVKTSPTASYRYMIDVLDQLQGAGADKISLQVLEE